MDKAVLLTDFQHRVDEFEKYQNFIARARSQSAKFASAVVDKVIKDNTEKSLVVVEQIIPLLNDVEDLIRELESERQGVIDGRSTSQFALEELELRQAIGELDDAAFAAESAGLKDALGSIDAKVSGFDEHLTTFRNQLARWEKLGTESGILNPPEPAPEPEAEPEPVKAEPAKAEVKAPPPPVVSPAAVTVPPSTPRLATPPRVVEPIPEISDIDVSSFEEERPIVPRVSIGARITEDVSAAFGEAVSDDKSIGDLEILGEDEVPGSDEVPAASDEARRAVLLYAEGTAEEQVYPFNGDEMTLGRGRDNDIQVKNDSKVSRYHCKLYRRGPAFYIEDNKSANGTLVNGELITERRLFGGEEIIIGETFFRFRIMD
jgi:hypothetical protein